MFHHRLQRQIRKLIPPDLAGDESLQPFLKAIHESYAHHDKDRSLSEHAFQINEKEYEDINMRLLQLTAELEQKVEERTREIQTIARFPLESPNPNFRVSIDGVIQYKNPAAEELKEFFYKGLHYTPQAFFQNILSEIGKNGTLEVDCGTKNMLFQYSSTPESNDILFYGTNVSERNVLRQRAYDNFYRLSNFLESTDDAYYVIYSKYTEKSFVTSKWAQIYGFNPNSVKNIFEERAKLIRKDFRKEYNKIFKDLALGDKVNLGYCAINSKTGQEFWLQEIVSKQNDAITGDEIISGRITNVTTQHYYSMQLKESEARFKLLMDTAPVMVWVSNEDHIIEYSNIAANEMLAKPFNQIVGQKEFERYVHPDDRHEAIDQWNAKLARRKISEIEFRLLDKDGHYRNVYQRAVPRYYNDGNFAGFIGVFFDLTKEKVLQTQLYEEKEKLEILSQNSPDTVILLDRKGKIEYASPSINRTLGYRPEELLDKSVYSLLKKNSEAVAFLKKSLALGEKPKLNRMEYQMVAKNGSLLWVESVLTFIHGGDKQGGKILLHNRDISLVKQAEDALRESEQKFRGLFEHMQLGVMEVDLDEKIVWVNKAFETMSGYTFRQLKGKIASQVFLDEKDSRAMSEVNQKRVEKKESLYEVRFRHKNGKFKEVVISGSATIDNKGAVKGSVGIHWDVTSIRETQRKLEQERLNKQHEIIQASLAAEERQKEILGRDLHDGVGQMLTYTSLYLQMAANAEKYDPNAFLAARYKILNILEEVRRISRSLIPPALTDLGLKEALIEMMNQYSAVKYMDFNLNFKVPQVEKLDFNAQTTLYRIIQEMTNNTLKYADATQVDISLSCKGSKFILKYKDNGRGFSMEKIKLGVGLKSITSRVKFYNGDVDINSSPNNGVQYLIEIPLINLQKK